MLVGQVIHDKTEILHVFFCKFLKFDKMIGILTRMRGSRIKLVLLFHTRRVATGNAK